MKTVLDEPTTQTSTQADQNCQLDENEAEIERRIERGIEEAKAALSEKLEEGRMAAERLVRHGRYAMEDGVSELAQKIKRHPISFLGIAFAAGAAFGLVISSSSKKQDKTPE